MLNETRLESKINLALIEVVNALIETQSILQLLVKKGIVTPDEVVATRNIVKSQPKYRQRLQDLNNMMNSFDDTVKFEELLEKSMKPDGNKNLTEDEKKYLLNMVL